MNSPNRLKNEKSPYLLQHAHNPVNWYPWGEEAFERSQNLDKPVFLSIGYSTCHWCHVMAHESFESVETAEILNKSFISVKVDREERPDIDAVYMDVCQSMTGSGGWPLTVIMTPEKKPFFVGTYFPPNTKNGMYGLNDILKQTVRLWNNDRKKLLKSSESIVSGLSESAESNVANDDDTDAVLSKAYRAFSAEYDSDFGGFGRPPKFPSPHNLIFLMRYGHRFKCSRASDMALNTLRNISKGGIRDHIGGGFSRYSTDKMWLVPHFEKMLYDNALLVLAYIEAYRFSRDEAFAETAADTLKYVEREMTSPEGGFFSAQDADSEGVEGKYYLLSKSEIMSLLGESDGEHFCSFYGITRSGNFEGLNIPNRINKTSLPDDRMHGLRELVFNYRRGRTSLHKDDKVLTVWNCIMITALSAAYGVLDNRRYLDAAVRAAEYIDKKLYVGDTLYIRHRDGESAGDGLLDDYAWYGIAMLSLYDAVFDKSYIGKAEKAARKIVTSFMDRDGGGCYINSSSGEQLITRPKKTYDGAIPSGNSAAAYLFARLANETESGEFLETAKKQIDFVTSRASEYPSGYCFALLAAMQAKDGKSLVCCLGENDFRVVKKRISSGYHPLTNVSFKKSDDGKTAFYLCENGKCLSPVDNLDEIIARI